MPFNGTGGFDPLPPPTYPAVAGEVIRAAYFNAVIDDIKTGLSQVLVRDGQAPITGDVDLTGHKFTNAANASASDEFLTLGQGNQGYLSRGVGAWITSADLPTPRERLYFLDDDATILRGHGTTPIVVRNSSNTTIANFLNSGGMSLGADAVAPEDVPRLAQVQTLVTPPASTAETKAGVLTTKAVTPKGLADTMLGGVGQTYQILTGSRSFGVTYTNTTDRPIFVSVWGQTTSATTSMATLVNGTTISNQGTSFVGIGLATFAVVQPGSTYRVDVTNVTLQGWVELA